MNVSAGLDCFSCTDVSSHRAVWAVDWFVTTDSTYGGSGIVSLIGYYRLQILSSSTVSKRSSILTGLLVSKTVLFSHLWGFIGVFPSLLFSCFVLVSDYTATDPLNTNYQILLASAMGMALFFYSSTSLNRPIVATAIFSYVNMQTHPKNTKLCYAIGSSCVFGMGSNPTRLAV